MLVGGFSTEMSSLKNLDILTTRCVSSKVYIYYSSNPVLSNSVRASTTWWLYVIWGYCQPGCNIPTHRILATAQNHRHRWQCVNYFYLTSLTDRGVAQEL
jgi:hypothetical protein